MIKVNQQLIDGKLVYFLVYHYVLNGCEYSYIFCGNIENSSKIPNKTFYNILEKHHSINYEHSIDFDNKEDAINAMNELNAFIIINKLSEVK